MKLIRIFSVIAGLFSIGQANAQTPHSVDLGWQCTGNCQTLAAGFKVYRSTGATGTESQLVALNGAGIRSYTDLSTSANVLTEGTQYCYTFTAVDAGGSESQHSTQICATIPFRLSAPTSPTATAH